MVDGVVEDEKQHIAGRRRRGAEATREDGDETRQEEETRDSSGGDKTMVERSVSKSVDSSLSLSENSSTEEEEKLQEEGRSSVERSGGMDDGRAAAAAAAVAAAVQQQQERQLQQQHLPPPRGEAASLQNALEQQQREEQKLFLEQLEARGPLRRRKKSIARDASSSFPVSPASSSSKDGHPVAAAAAAGAWRRPSAEDAAQEEDIGEEERKGESSRRKAGKSPSSSSRRGKAVRKASLTDISSLCTSAARPHAARALSPVHRPTWPAAAAASAEGAADAGAAAAAGQPLLAGKERGSAAAAAASSSSPVGAPVGRSRGSVGWTAAAGYHHGRRSSSTGRPQQHVQEACFDDVIVRPFEEQDAAAVRRLCYRHFRSLTLPSVFFWICHHSVDAAALFCISLCFLPIRGVLLSAACFFIYLLLRGVYEFELYIKRDCPDLDDIYQSYMRSRASGFWVAERLERSVSSPQQTAAASSGGERGGNSSSSGGNSTPDDGAASPHAKVRLVVDRSQRRQHIGTLLLNTLIAYALQQHYSIIRLYTNNLNSDSIRFAKTKGFELQQIVRRGLMRGDLLKWQKKLEVPGMAQQRKTRTSKLVSSVLD